MELAMKKAKEVGVAWVTCTGEKRQTNKQTKKLTDKRQIFSNLGHNGVHLHCRVQSLWYSWLLLSHGNEGRTDSKLLG